MNWNEIDLTSNHDMPQLLVPYPVTYLRLLIRRSGYQGPVIWESVMIAIYNILYTQLSMWGCAIDMEKEMQEMLQVVLLREDTDYQMLLNACNILDDTGALYNGTKSLLENDIPKTLIELIQNGYCDIPLKPFGSKSFLGATSFRDTGVP